MMFSDQGTTVGSIALRTNGALRLRNGSTTMGADSAALVAGTLYRVGLHQKKGTGSNAVLEAYVATGDAAFGASFASTTTGAWTTQADRLQFGATTSTALNATFDNIRLDSGSMPPAGAAPGRTQVTLARAPQTGGAFARVIAASAPLNGTVPSLLVNLSVAEPAPPVDVLARPLAAPAFSTLLLDGAISTTVTYEYDNLYRLTKTTYSGGATFEYTLRLRSGQALRCNGQPPEPDQCVWYMHATHDDADGIGQGQFPITQIFPMPYGGPNTWSMITSARLSSPRRRPPVACARTLRVARTRPERTPGAAVCLLHHRRPALGARGRPHHFRLSARWLPLIGTRIPFLRLPIPAAVQRLIRQTQLHVVKEQRIQHPLCCDPHCGRPVAFQPHHHQPPRPVRVVQPIGVNDVNREAIFAHRRAANTPQRGRDAKARQHGVPDEFGQQPPSGGARRVPPQLRQPFSEFFAHPGLGWLIQPVPQGPQRGPLTPTSSINTEGDSRTLQRSTNSAGAIISQLYEWRFSGCKVFGQELT